jgi:hypothetical protein
MLDRDEVHALRLAAEHRERVYLSEVMSTSMA